MMASEKLADAAPPVQLTWIERLGLFHVYITAYLIALCKFLTAPFRPLDSSLTLRKHVLYPITRTFNEKTTIRQQQFLNPTTDETYVAFCAQAGREPDTTVLPDGAKCHWLGEREAPRVIIFFHGGGFALPANYHFFPLLQDLADQVSEDGLDTAVAFLSYTVTPHATYPTQVLQGMHLLRHVLHVERKDPSNVILGGDSAGGNLTLAILSHLLHPHPSPMLEPLVLHAPLAGAALLSPWVSFATDGPAYTINEDRDVLTKVGTEQWARAYLGNLPSDNYTEAVRAPAEWWTDLASVVHTVLVVGASDELLVDSIRQLAVTLTSKHPRVTDVTVAGAHDEFLLNGIVGAPRNEPALILQKWVVDTLG